jgi:uncharacterized phage protein (TIGR01671 family)
MSRELKFRIFDKDVKRFLTEDDVKDFELFLTTNGEVYSQKFGNIHKSYEAQQYTGLKGKNGVEIYEGDIIHYKFDGDSYPKEAVDRILTCSYDEDEGMYSFDNSDHSYYWAEIKRHCNIIGSLLENPELLEQ